VFAASLPLLTSIPAWGAEPASGDAAGTFFTLENDLRGIEPHDLNAARRHGLGRRVNDPDCRLFLRAR
jgi:hypothetical protein